MNEQARLTLQHTIQELERLVPPDYVQGSHKAAAEKLPPDDPEVLRVYVTASQLFVESRLAGYMAAIKALFGANLLTPSPTQRGWKFWKAPLFSAAETKDLVSALERSTSKYNRQLERWNRDFDSFDASPPKVDLPRVIEVAKIADIVCASIRHHSAGFSKVLRKYEG